MQIKVIHISFVVGSAAMCFLIKRDLMSVLVGSVTASILVGIGVLIYRTKTRRYAASFVGFVFGLLISLGGLYILNLSGSILNENNNQW